MSCSICFIPQSKKFVNTNNIRIGNKYPYNKGASDHYPHLGESSNEFSPWSDESTDDKNACSIQTIVNHMDSIYLVERKDQIKCTISLQDLLRRISPHEMSMIDDLSLMQSCLNSESNIADEPKICKPDFPE